MIKSKKLQKTFLIVGGVLAVLLIVVSIVCTTVLYDLLCLVLDRPKPIYAEDSIAMYIPETMGKEDAYSEAAKTNIEVCKEGFVLLKNKGDALPLQKNSKVTIFGKNSINLSYGGSGSGSFSLDPTSALYNRLTGLGLDLEYKNIYQAFDGYFDTNPTMKTFYEDDSVSGDKRSNSNVDLDSGDDKIFTVGESPINKYTQTVKDSYSSYKDVAFVVLTRIGGEGADLPRHQGNSAGAVSPDSHYLELDKNEIDMLTHVCDSGFEKVVVLLNTPSAMEVDFLYDSTKFPFSNKIDACMWIGFPGRQGIMALGPILTAEDGMSPSGRTVDTWASDLLAAPSTINFGTGINQTKVSNKQQFDQYNEGLYYFVEYEEGIYVGYRYYETRGFVDGETWYQENVTYPFGYGLSYTDFEWNVTAPSANTITKTDKIEVNINVKNVGLNYKGKDTVEIYASAPYSDGEIEKAHKVLVGFAKTKELNPGESDNLKIEINPYDFASYDDRDLNGNGFYGYELEAGEYTFYVSSDAHTSIDSFKMNVASDIFFDTDPVTGNIVGNRFIDEDTVSDTVVSNYNDIDSPLDVKLSRSDFAGTFPTEIGAADRVAGADLLSQLKEVSSNNPNDYYDETKYEKVSFGKDVTVKVTDLLPTETPESTYLPIVSYDDSRWETIIQSCASSELVTMYNQGAYQTRELNNVGMPLTLHADGPSGYTCFLNQDTICGTNQYCSEPVFASTWNTELIEKLGKAIGEEGLWGYDVTNQPYSGIYAPGANIHRSQFGGRCSEYFSECPFITGKMAAAEIRGIQSKGVCPFIKHFAVNEQETHRSVNGDCSWLTEQSLREIYLKGFEIGVKEGSARGLMTSFNRIGSVWTGGDYRLCTEILRDEWGFKGCIICDFNTCPQHMNGRQMAYAGGDLNLQTSGGGVFDFDENDVGDCYILQQAIKNIMYSMVNSNAFNGEIIGYNSPNWVTLIIVIDIVGGVISLGLIGWAVVSILLTKKS